MDADLRHGPERGPANGGEAGGHRQNPGRKPRPCQTTANAGPDEEMEPTIGVPPHPEMASIVERLAFYPNVVAVTEA